MVVGKPSKPSSVWAAGQPTRAAVSSSGARGASSRMPTTVNQRSPMSTWVPGLACPTPRRSAAVAPSTVAGYAVMPSLSQVPPLHPPASDPDALVCRRATTPGPRPTTSQPCDRSPATRPPPHPVAWWREAHGEQRAVATGLIAAAVGAASLALAVWPGGGGERPPVTAPTMTVPQTVTTPPRAEPPGPAWSSRPPTSGPSASELLPSALPSPSEAAVSAGEISPEAPEVPSPSGPATPRPSVDPERPDEERCLLDLDVPLIGVAVGRLLCL